MIFEHFLNIYLIYYLSVLAHELAHVIVANMIGLKLIGFHMGDNLFSVNYKSISISPLVVFGGQVDFIREELLKKENFEIILFFLAGPATNLLLFLLSYNVIPLDSIGINALRVFNVVILVKNLSPIFVKGNDVKQLILYKKIKAEMAKNKV